MTLIDKTHGLIPPGTSAEAVIDNLTGIIKVDTAADSNIASLSGEQTINGVTTSESLVLLYSQSTATQNGIWKTSSGAWSRSSFADEDLEIRQKFISVQQGTLAGNLYQNTNAAAIVIDTTNITYVQRDFVTSGQPYYLQASVGTGGQYATLAAAYAAGYRRFLVKAGSNITETLTGVTDYIVIWGEPDGSGNLPVINWGNVTLSYGSTVANSLNHLEIYNCHIKIADPSTSNTWLKTDFMTYMLLENVEITNESTASSYVGFAPSVVNTYILNGELRNVTINQGEFGMTFGINLPVKNMTLSGNSTSGANSVNLENCTIDNLTIDGTWDAPITTSNNNNALFLRKNVIIKNSDLGGFDMMTARNSDSSGCKLFNTKNIKWAPIATYAQSLIQFIDCEIDDYAPRINSQHGPIYCQHTIIRDAALYNLMDDDSSLIDCTLTAGTTIDGTNKIIKGCRMTGNMTFTCTGSIVEGNITGGDFAISGDNNSVCNNDIGGNLTLNAGAENNRVLANDVTGTFTDNSGNTTNEINNNIN